VRIDHLTVKNFNGFDHREFDFNPRFNLLVGDNATGKTSVLDALSIALGSWFLGIPGYANILGIDAKEVRVVAHPHQDSCTFEKQFPSRVETCGLVLGRDIKWTRELSREGGRTSSVDAKTISTIAGEAERKVRSGEEITLPLICAYGTERLWIEATHRPNKKREGSKGRLPSRLDGYLDCAETSASIQSPPIETIALRAVKRAIVGSVEGAMSLYYDERYKDIVVNFEQYGYQLFQNLSDGQRIVLTLVGDLVKRATTLNPHLADRVLDETPGVVLIDELDLHLHPKWQRRVIRDLKTTFPSIQFIATTHSPQLVGEAAPEEVILLGEQQATNPAQSYGMDSNWILRYVMGADERDTKVKGKLEEIEKLILSFDFSEARAKVDEVRAEIGNSPELVRLSARIDRLAEKSR